MQGDIGNKISKVKRALYIDALDRTAGGAQAMNWRVVGVLCWAWLTVWRKNTTQMKCPSSDICEPLFPAVHSMVTLKQCRGRAVDIKGPTLEFYKIANRDSFYLTSRSPTIDCPGRRLKMWRWKKKNSWVGATSWYHCVAEDPRILKMPVINPLQALVHPQTQKNYPAWIVNSLLQLLKIRLFW
jgi:hypothetical protein